MGCINALSDRLISQIAAGEVVERPASVVKELVENALDAGAQRIGVELEEGGKRRIRVSDDGGGMDGADARLAFDRHATSKIGTFEDLERIGTLGFRGEALSSIGAVARVELVTAASPGDGHRVRVEGGRLLGVEPAARSRGTTVEVDSLFFNVPARRKFLKTAPTESRRSLEVVQGYALARPDVRFEVDHEGRRLLDAAPAGEGAEGARNRIRQIFGASLASHLVDLGEEGRRIWGFLGDRATTRGRRYFIFVNRRLIRDRAVLAAFYRSIRGEWRGEDFPALFLFLDLPPEEVDVNVHPQKSEVRFRDPRLIGAIFNRIRDAANRALGEEGAPLATPGSPPVAPFVWEGLGRPPSPGGGEVREGEAGAVAGRVAEAVYPPAERAPVPLSGRSGQQLPFRLLGQYKGTLILLEGPEGLYVIDQHVAHERILYERLRVSLAREKTVSQALLEPHLLEVGPAEAARLEELGPDLASCGFELSFLSGGSVAVAAIPAVLDVNRSEKLLLGLAREDGDSLADPGGLRQKLLETLAANLACRAAVKMHDPLSPDKMEALVTELFAADQPYVCPHGRPTVLEMSDRDLERHFGRR